MIDVFVSRPTWISTELQDGLDSFYNLLKTLEFNPRSLGTADYTPSAPLDAIIQIMSKCYGAIILGYPQINVKDGTVKSEAIQSPLLLATEWNHIEAGLAYARQLPLLVIHHTGVVRGIFDRGASNRFIYEVDLSDPRWTLKDPLSGAIRSWKTEIITFHNSQPRDSQADRPFCPNCSTPQRRIYLTRLPGVYQQAFDATHQCPKCMYREKVD